MDSNKYSTKDEFTVNRRILPIGEPEYAAVTGRDAQTATPPGRFAVKAPDGAPNVMVVLLDDMGFGTSTAFGGPVNMPAAERLAGVGLRYSQFHTTALCAPTRAAILSGYNHHTNNMGTIPEMGTAFPGNTSVRPQSVTPLAFILRENGYCTAQIGKCHETPPWEVTPVGPYAHWPTFSGFDKFYGFMGGETNQYHPELYDGITQLPTPDDPNYHLSEDLADQAIGWVELQKAVAPEKPFFLYLAPGATHSPHQAPKEYIDRYRGKFDDGWDALRARTLENMKRMGIAPAEAELARKPDDVPDWDSLSEREKQLYARQMEVYAGFAEHVDAQIGRVLDALERMKLMENTVVFYILGDNGASAEGLMGGLFNEHTTMNGIAEDFEQTYSRMDKLGTDEAFNHYSAAWAIALDAPFTWAKQVASNYGGTRNGMIVCYPPAIKEGGGIRNQFHHCVDVCPTILELTGIPHPELVNGVGQRPLEGVSMAYSFGSTGAESTRKTQYFCIGANYGIYHDGWFAGVVSKIPWVKQPVYSSYEAGVWELYHVAEDFSMSRDVARSNPKKLGELQRIFEAEAEKYHVFPIDSRGHQLFDARYAGRPDFASRCKEITLGRGSIGLKESCFPNLKNTSYTITADVEVDDTNSDGVIIAQGGRFGGWCLYTKNKVPIFAYNFVALEQYFVRAQKPLASGTNQILLKFVYDGGGNGKGGTAEMIINGVEQGRGRIEKTIPMLISFTESTCVGMDRGTPVCEEYTVANSRFQGKINQIHVSVDG